MPHAGVLLSVLLAAPGLFGDDGNAMGLDVSLEAFLPGKPGYTWIYWGFAEYGHRMRLDAITETDSGRVYRVSGRVEDVSDGEAPGDYTMSLCYLLSDSVLTLVQRAPRAMDNDFSRMELLRLPLTAGSAWLQTATGADGSEMELLCQITHADPGSLTVRYSDTQGPFFQVRVFEPGVGITAFEKLYLHPGGNFEMGYLLYRGSKP